MEEVTKTYNATARRGERYWIIEVPEIGHSTQARNVKEVDVMARDLIAVMLEVPADSFDVDVHFEVPQEAKGHLEAAARLREAAARANASAAEESRAAAFALKQMGLPLRDIGKLLGVSFQRADQLAKGAR